MYILRCFSNPYDFNITTPYSVKDIVQCQGKRKFGIWKSVYNDVTRRFAKGGSAAPMPNVYHIWKCRYEKPNKTIYDKNGYKVELVLTNVTEQSFATRSNDVYREVHRSVLYYDQRLTYKQLFNIGEQLYQLDNRVVAHTNLTNKILEQQRVTNTLLRQTANKEPPHDVNNELLAQMKETNTCLRGLRDVFTQIKTKNSTTKPLDKIEPLLETHFDILHSYLERQFNVLKLKMNNY